MFDRPIAISLSPNTKPDDVRQAASSLLNIYNWQKGSWEKKVISWFKKYFQVNQVYLFNSGRSALYCLLKSFNIGPGMEVIIQSFTCVAVPDPIIWVGAKPVYSDIDNSLNIDPAQLTQYITDKTKAIIVQHTFGIPAQIHMIKKITQKYNLILIEDCAHSLGATHQGKRIGSFGDAAFFSFGRDKVISSVFGGAAFIRNKSENLKNLSNIYSSLSYPDYKWIVKQVIHPLAFFFILPLYNYYLGKFILYCFQKITLLSKPIEPIELTGGLPSFIPYKLPNALARLAYHQLKKLSLFNVRRQAIARFYFRQLKDINNIFLPPDNKEAIYLRFNILVKNRDKLYRFFRQYHILLGLWYANVIDPAGVEFDKIAYTKGSSEYAEKMASLSLNLPTYPSLTDKDSGYIVELIRKYADKNNRR